LGVFDLLFQRKRAGRSARVSYESARERAAAGAAFLDEQQPGWYEIIDVDGLELSHGGACVLGQLHGEFRMGLGRAAIFNFSSAPRANLSPVRLGFLCVQGVSAAEQDRDYDLLNAAWREEIRRRRQVEKEDEERIAESGATNPATAEQAVLV